MRAVSLLTLLAAFLAVALVAQPSVAEEHEDTFEMEIDADGDVVAGGGGGGGAAQVETTRFELEHSLTQGRGFSSRGTVVVETSTTTRQRLLRLDEKLTLTDQERESVRELIETNGLYQVRLRSSASNSSSPYVLAALRICDLVKSGFKEEIKLLLDSTGAVLSLEYRAPAGVFSAKRECSNPNSLPSTVAFSSAVAHLLPTPAQQISIQPPNTPPPPGMQGVKATNPDGTPMQGEQKQPGILRKYWYIILPLALMILTSGAEPPPQGGAGGAPTGGSAAR